MREREQVWIAVRWSVGRKSTVPRHRDRAAVAGVAGFRHRDPGWRRRLGLRRREVDRRDHRSHEDDDPHRETVRSGRRSRARCEAAQRRPRAAGCSRAVCWQWSGDGECLPQLRGRPLRVPPGGSECDPGCGSNFACRQTARLRNHCRRPARIRTTAIYHSLALPQTKNWHVGWDAWKNLDDRST